MNIFSAVVSKTQHYSCSLVTYISIMSFNEFAYRELRKSLIFLEKQFVIVNIRV